MQILNQIIDANRSLYHSAEPQTRHLPALDTHANQTMQTILSIPRLSRKRVTCLHPIRMHLHLNRYLRFNGCFFPSADRKLVTM